jgi:S1-C subfamily serine protease
VIVSAAGGDIASPADLVATIARVAFGTWLPVTVRRDDRVLEIVAKFPANAATHP